MIPCALFLKKWVIIVGGRQVLSLAVKTAIKLLSDRTENYAGIIIETFDTSLLKSIGYLLDYVCYFLYAHSWK